jgi:DNA-binding transcriptional ArsR family regulator
MPPSTRPPAEAKSSAALFAALGDPTRLALVSRLCEGPKSIAGLTAGSKVTRQAITKHLRVLEDARLVHGIRQGRERIWRLDQGRLEDARRYLDLISEQWDRALSRLRAFVEK